MKFFKELNSESSGFTLVTTIVTILILGVLSSTVAATISTNISISTNIEKSQKAFNIAEAGVNYYLWHLSHNTTDYRDGKSTPATPDATLGYGPYEHVYTDSSGIAQGTYTLWIKPENSNSTVVKVRSIGKAYGSNATRTVDAKIGAPSYTSYSLVNDGAFWIGSKESVSGPIHSNQGIRMDGANDADVTSANATYVPPSSLGGNGFTSYPGVWCSSAVTTPVNCSTRSKASWRYPVPTVDFNQLSGDICKLKKQAFLADSSTASIASLSTACSAVPTTRTSAYIPQRSTSFSVSIGYLISLNTNGTYDLAQVNAENDTLTPYTSALSLVTLQTGIAIPTGGVIFVEDNVWVRTAPTFDGRVTIGSGKLATNDATKINIAGQIKYAAKDGTDAIGLVAEGSVSLAPYAPPASGDFTFEINAALISQTGNVLYYNVYRANPGRCTRGWTGANQKLLLYGTVATRNVWTWSWYGGYCPDSVYDATLGYYISGFSNNTTQFDYNLMYAPPPYFPITSTYNVLEWREVIATP